MGKFWRVPSTEIIGGKFHRLAKLPTDRRVERRSLEEAYRVPAEEIKKCAHGVGITIGPMCHSKYKIDIKRLL